jgi:hypothetical protein
VVDSLQALHAIQSAPLWPSRNHWRAPQEEKSWHVTYGELGRVVGIGLGNVEAEGHRGVLPRTAQRRDDDFERL